MKCPKCHTELDDKTTVCPKCHKVLLLECPNCHSLEDTPICTQCGYKILVKCSKCGRINPTFNDLCTQCGFPTKTSVAMQECETDELASVIVKFSNLKKIRRLLKSKEMYEKFYYKLKNLMLAQVKNAEGLFITYGDAFVLNFNKELSLPTSANKAVRFALKLVNAFAQLNLNVIEELRVPIGLNISIVRKPAEELQTYHSYENNVKLLNLKKDTKKYLKGIQIITDQYIWDEINKEYKTDSLYSLEENGTTTMFYEILLDSYVLPPETDKDKAKVNAVQNVLPKTEHKNSEQDMYSFNVFDINAKCTFETTNAVSIKEKLRSMDFEKNAKVLSLRSNDENSADMNDIIEVCREKDLRPITIICTDTMCYEPWGFFIRLFKEVYGLSYLNKEPDEQIKSSVSETFRPLLDLCMGKAAQATSSEDARFAYIELWGKFLSVLSKTAIIVDGFENLDDTSLQTIELYFDKLRKIAPNFVFITSEKVSAHSKMKDLLRMETYTELKLTKSTFANCLSTIKLDASDFIGSFYFEKIQENFNGSYLYFKQALNYLLEMGVLVVFENKLLLRGAKSVVIPPDINGIYRARLKNFGKSQDVSFIIAYSTLLYPGLDFQTLETLGIKDINSNAQMLCQSGIARLEGQNIIINNFHIYKDVISSALKREAEVMLAKNILGNAGRMLNRADMALLLSKTESFGDEYAFLCANADFAISTGDYDAYLKNCLGFLSLIESVENVIPQEEIDGRKQEVYESILKYLYGYAPTKIYFIENILLTDALNENDNDKIVRLSNMMLQGALVSSNYTDALGLLHNILSRMQNPTLLVDGAVNTKFLLLSLVSIEILYNIGKYRECAETAGEILSVISADMLDKIKPAGFSVSSFVSHLLETMSLAAFAKLYLMDEDLDNFFDLVVEKLNADIPDKDCILAIRDFLAGKVYNIGDVESYTPFSKAIFLILQEISNLQAEGDYKKFAQNIYQAKLLAEDIYRMEIKYLCDMLIAYAYAKIGITAKAEFIFKDVLQSAEVSAMFATILISKYFLARMEKDPQKALLITNDALNMIRKHDNQAVILFVMFEKLYIRLAQENELPASNIDIEEQKLLPYANSLKVFMD